MIQEKQLAQARENSTSAVSVFSPGADETVEITCITLCNTSGAAVTFRIFTDDNGTTYDESTARYWDAPLPADSTLTLKPKWYMNNSAGNLAYRSSVANAITITVDGAVMT